MPFTLKPAMHGYTNILIALVCLIATPFASAGIQFISMDIKGQAVAKIDKKTHRLKPGKSKGNTKLLWVTKKEAIFEIDDKSYLFKKGSSKGELLNTRMQLNAGPYGMFQIKGSINQSKPVMFLVDTGATFVSISTQLAKRLKLRYKKLKKIKLMTASKREHADLIMVESIKIGNIIINNVHTVLLRGKHPAIPLLGMSFLSQLNISYGKHTLTLSK